MAGSVPPLHRGGAEGFGRPRVHRPAARRAARAGRRLTKRRPQNSDRPARAAASGGAAITLPRPLHPFVSFPSLLRAHAFSVAPEQTETFVAAVGLLGPRGMGDIHAAAVATLAPPLERRAAFDALFRAHFLGQAIAAPALADPDVEIAEPEDGAAEPLAAEEETRSGAGATAAEALAGRAFADLTEAEAMRRFRRAAPAALPRRRSRRFTSRRGGERPDARRALRETVRREGELSRLPMLARRIRQRRILLLVDVSGSMKAHTDGALRLAHALVHAAERAAVFTVGTRLTRVTRPLRRRSRAAALEAAAAAVPDWDGGTRLGDALAAFLGVPRYAGFARSAAVVVVSDGLERGGPDALALAMRHLSRLAFRILWLSPLAVGGAAPETEAMRAILPFIDRIGDGSATARMAGEILHFARER